MRKQALWRFVLIVVCVVAVAGSASAVEFGLFGYDVRAGLVVPSDWDTGFAIGASANIAELYDGLYLYPGVVYSQAEDTAGSGLFEADLEVTSLALGAEVRYFLAQEQRGWYFGGGPYLHFLDREILVFGRRSVASVDHQEVAITGVAGYKLGAGRSGLLLEARYSIVSGYDNGQILVGYSF